MKNILLTLTILFAGLTSYCQTQKLPVQGKLFIDNAPALDVPRLFVFSITTLPTFQPVSETITTSGGLYTYDLEVPSDLFANQNTHDVQITVEGTPLPIVKIHAPIEKDPTVPAYLKDGVSWSEITDIPAIDYDDTNELQTLSLMGNKLSISGGNTVELDTAGSSNGVFDTLCVGPAELACVIAAESQSGSGLSSPSTSVVSQTFKPLVGGHIKSIEVFCTSLLPNQPITFTVKQVGNSQLYASNVCPGPGCQAFTSNLSYQQLIPQQAGTLPLEQYEDYILEINVGGGSYTFGVDADNPYKFGESNFGPSTDLKFKVNIEAIVGPSMKVDSNGYVGIGTANPTSTLTVNGRIEDKTGFLMPVGSIIPFAGPPTALPKGWLICNAQTISKIEYADLYNVLGDTWGTVPGEPTLFRIPDLRAQFLRGWSDDSNLDPDKESRTYYNGGQPPAGTGNVVGSYQSDAFKSHTHSLIDGSDTGAGNPKVRPVLAANNALPFGPTGAAGGSETRPRNVYVLYIIKY